MEPTFHSAAPAITNRPQADGSHSSGSADRIHARPAASRTQSSQPEATTDEQTAASASDSSDSDSSSASKSGSNQAEQAIAGKLLSDAVNVAVVPGSVSKPGQPVHLVRTLKRPAEEANLGGHALAATVVPDESVSTTASAANSPSRTAAGAPLAAAITSSTAGTPGGALAFALRLKGGGSRGASNPTPAGQINRIGAGAKNAALQLAGRAPGSAAGANAGASGGTTDDGNSEPNASPFAAQLKALTGSLNGSAAVRPIDVSVANPVTADNSALLANSGMLNTPPQMGTEAAPAASSQPASTVSANPTEDETPLSNEPVRSVRVQIAGDDSQRVDLHLVEHAGALSVSVRSADGTLRTSLQDSLPELNSRLAAEHYQTETWTPGGAAANSGGNNGSDTSGGNRQGGSQPEGHPGSNGGQPQGGQPNGQQHKAPVWVQELAAFEGGVMSQPGIAP